MARPRGPSKKSYPEIDMLMAYILERMHSMHITRKELADKIEYSTVYLNTCFNKSPWEWQSGMRIAVCKELGITTEMMQQCYPGGV